MFTSLKLKEMETVYFENNNKLKVLMSGNIILNSSVFVKKFLYVENLNFNLLSISQLCATRYKIEFLSYKCIVECVKELKLTLLGVKKNSIYTINLPSSSHKCFIPQREKTKL